MHWVQLLAATLAGCSLLAGSAAAADIAAGRAKAREVCAGCHGVDGLSKVPDAPNIAGQPEIYFTAQLEAYRSGARQHEVMNVVAKDLTDADIENLTAYYGSIKVTVKVPPAS